MEYIKVCYDNVHVVYDWSYGVFTNYCIYGKHKTHKNFQAMKESEKGWHRTGVSCASLFSTMEKAQNTLNFISRFAGDDWTFEIRKLRMR